MLFCSDQNLALIESDSKESITFSSSLGNQHLDGRYSEIERSLWARWSSCFIPRTANSEAHAEAQEALYQTISSLTPSSSPSVDSFSLDISPSFPDVVLEVEIDELQAQVETFNREICTLRDELRRLAEGREKLTSENTCIMLSCNSLLPNNSSYIVIWSKAILVIEKLAWLYGPDVITTLKGNPPRFSSLPMVKATAMDKTLQGITTRFQG
ncbi:hypothetical protein HHK36_010084 [Tetracentron sinense]|uniref:Uncharacterized protein n=1 Tax=Tetracentron sinense TaxID=13715 RepID=A0A835DM94_TETSI|nr:hypothetical protein HHK36_010084 [Tetracentron sinense]